MKPTILLIFICVSMSVFNTGCRTARHVSQVSEETQVSGQSVELTEETSISEQTAVETTADSVAIQEEESGVINIVRDPEGRPSEIYWRKKSSGVSSRSGKKESKTISESSVTAKKENAASEDIRKQKKEEEKEEKSAMTPSPGWLFIYPVILIVGVALLAFWAYRKGGGK